MSRHYSGILRGPFAKLLVTGPTGCSKSTTLEIIFDCLDNWIDTPANVKRAWRDNSGFLAESKRRKTAAGLQLLEMAADEKAGKVLDTGPVISSIDENLAWIKERYQHIELLGLAGCTRHPLETAYWKGHRRTRQVLIDATPEQVAASIKSRMEKARLRNEEVRPDDGSTLALKLEEYENKIKPAVNAFPPHLVLRINRSMPLRTRVEKMVLHMWCEDTEETLISRTTFEMYMDRLASPNDHVHTAIAAVESGSPTIPHRPIEEKQRFTSPEKHHSDRAVQVTVPA